MHVNIHFCVCAQNWDESLLFFLCLGEKRRKNEGEIYSLESRTALLAINKPAEPIKIERWMKRESERERESESERERER